MARPGAVRLETDDNRKKRPAWIWLLLGLLGVAALLLLLSQCGNNDDRAATGGTAPGSTASASTTGSAPSGSTTASATGEAADTPTDANTAAGSVGPASDGAAGGGTLTADRTALPPLATAAATDGSLAKYKDQSAAGKGVRVQSVPADEGFWVGTSDKDRVWVQLTGTSESGYTVKAGDVVTFTGQVTANTADFPAKVGVEAAEGADQLTTQGVHILVQRNKLALDS